MKVFSIITSFFLILATVLIVASPVTAAEYKIKEGETLSQVAKKLDHSVDELKVMNFLEDEMLNVGQILNYVSQEDKENARKGFVYTKTQVTDSSSIANYDQFIKNIDEDDLNYSDPSMMKDDRLSVFSLINLSCDVQGIKRSYRLSFFGGIRNQDYVKVLKVKTGKNKTFKI